MTNKKTTLSHFELRWFFLSINDVPANSDNKCTAPLFSNHQQFSCSFVFPLPLACRATFRILADPVWSAETGDETLA